MLFALIELIRAEHTFTLHVIVKILIIYFIKYIIRRCFLGYSCIFPSKNNQRLIVSKMSEMKDMTSFYSIIKVKMKGNFAGYYTLEPKFLSGKCITLKNELVLYDNKRQPNQTF